MNKFSKYGVSALNFKDLGIKKKTNNLSMSPPKLLSQRVNKIRATMAKKINFNF